MTKLQNLSAIALVARITECMEVDLNAELGKYVASHLKYYFLSKSGLPTLFQYADYPTAIYGDFADM